MSWVHKVFSFIKPLLNLDMEYDGREDLFSVHFVNEGSTITYVL